MKILIIKLSSIGDLIHSIPAFNALQKASNKQNNIEIDWLVYEKFAKVLSKSIPETSIKTLKDKKFLTLVAKATELKNQYDLVIDLQGLFKTALMSKIIAANANYGFKMPREAWAKYFYKNSFCDYKSIECKKHVIEQNLELCQKICREVLGIELNQEIDFSLVTTKAQTKNKKQICLIPCTTWESKHWQVDNWTKLINELDTDADFFLTGAPTDISYLEKIKNSTTKNLTLVTDKKLEDLFEFYSAMDIVIGVDTGPLHIAAAALYGKKDKKIVGIYGPSSASRSGPYGFSAISADEVFDIQATNKKTYHQDMNSINKLNHELILEKLS